MGERLMLPPVVLLPLYCELWFPLFLTQFSVHIVHGDRTQIIVMCILVAYPIIHIQGNVLFHCSTILGFVNTKPFYLYADTFIIIGRKI